MFQVQNHKFGPRLLPVSHDEKIISPRTAIDSLPRLGELQGDAANPHPGDTTYAGSMNLMWCGNEMDRDRCAGLNDRGQKPDCSTSMTTSRSDLAPGPRGTPHPQVHFRLPHRARTASSKQTKITHTETIIHDERISSSQAQTPTPEDQSTHGETDNSTCTLAMKVSQALMKSEFVKAKVEEMDETEIELVIKAGLLGLSDPAGAGVGDGDPGTMNLALSAESILADAKRHLKWRRDGAGGMEPFGDMTAPQMDKGRDKGRLKCDRCHKVKSSASDLKYCSLSSFSHISLLHQMKSKVQFQKMRRRGY